MPRQQVAATAIRIGKANVHPAGTLSLPRYFSRTALAAEEEKFAAEEEKPAADEEKPDGEQALWEAAQNGSDNFAPLESSLTERERLMKEGFTIFISNVTFDATETHLTEAFRKYGDITQTNIGRDGRGLSRGFAFVTFATKDAADRAVAEANNSFWHGRRIMVDHRKGGTPPNKVRENTKSQPSESLYIGNIPYETSDADLNQLFRSLDGVKDVRVAIDRNTGWPRGFAHADFHDVESAEKAYELLQEKTLGGRTLRIDFAESRRKT